jgi:predicted MFS family arabinose efflux permease
MLPEWTQGGPREISLLAFGVVGIGCVGCVLGGIVSMRLGSFRIAASALVLSGLMCAIAPLSANWPVGWRAAILFTWGLAVVADSPHFSNLSRAACPPALVGSALSIQNAIGFAITTVSIWIGTRLFETAQLQVAWILLIGPVLGLLAMFKRQPAQ